MNKGAWNLPKGGFAAHWQLPIVLKRIGFTLAEFWLNFGGRQVLSLLAGRLIRRSSAVEQLTVNQLVAGSNPAAGATKSNT